MLYELKKIIATSTAEHETQVAVAVSAYVSVLVLYTYDHLLNLGREIDLMWPGPFGLSNILYFTTRYLPFVKMVYNLTSVSEASMSVPPKNYNLTPFRSCAIGLHIVNAFHILSRTSVTLVLFFQPYAVYRQSWKIIVTLGPLGLALIVIDAIESSARICSLTPLADHEIHTVLSLSLLTAFPTAVMGLTLHRIISIIRKKGGLKKSLAKGGGLTNLILFESVCILRLFNALSFVPTFNLGVNPFALPVAAILLSHFLLSLRDVSMEMDREDDQSTHAPAFTTFPVMVTDQVGYLEEGGIRSGRDFLSMPETTGGRRFDCSLCEHNWTDDLGVKMEY
ncbi:hypothetical protein M422DRAFT_24123 [Sphaerobolus stellatus SS14]|nr:hypothetical protein M422DRAFT_24123 [Sphaerobolus stellatus SS14]